VTDTYTFDGVDIRTVAQIASYEGLWDPPPLRGDDLTVPTLNGVVPVTNRPFGVGTLTLQLVLVASDLITRNDALKALEAVVKPGTVMTAVRTRTFTSGVESKTAQVRYASGLSPTMVGVSVARLAVTFDVLSGVWS
jgi:hypothetical protein